VIHNFNADGFEALYPRYRGGRPPTFTLPEWQAIKRVALSRARPITAVPFPPGAWPSWPTPWLPRGGAAPAAPAGHLHPPRVRHLLGAYDLSRDRR